MRRNAALFVLISLLDGFGSTAMGISAGLWLLDLTHSVPLAALAGICTYAPVFLGPWIGAAVDHLPRRPLMVTAEAATAALLLTLLAVHSAGTAWLVFAILLARGLLAALVDAGETAILPSALPPAVLGTVNGWRSSALEGTKLVAPLAGAGLYAWRGPTPVVLLCAAIPLVTAFCYTLLDLHPPGSRPDPAAQQPAPAAGRTASEPPTAAAIAPQPRGRTARHVPTAASSHTPTEPPGTPVVGVPTAGGAASPGAADGAGPGARGGLWAGVALIFRLPAVRVPVLVAAVAIAMSGLTNAAVLAHIVDDLHLPSARLGIVTSAQGAGSILSGLLAGRLLKRLGPTRVAVIGAALFGVGRLAWALPWFPPAVAGSVVIGLGLPWTLIAGITAIQTETPDHLLGRAAGSSNTVMFGPVALALPLGSALVHLGALTPTLIAAGLSFAAALFGIRARRLRTRTPLSQDANSRDDQLIGTRSP
ncbi:MFS transporter [Actinoplanes sp. NPDC051411]|uniref:MFS transporter n=1 Tax=Actinoplanes sp. NPDC051411 TaxID=3155522 RepID=UPI0034409A99